MWRTWREQQATCLAARAARRGRTRRRARPAPPARRRLADEDRRVALGVARRLALAQGQHQVHEVRRLVALEDGHELLVVDPERVRRVVVDRRELVPDPHVLLHRPLPVGLGQRVPGAHLHERVDDEVRRALRDDLAGLARARVLGGLRRRQVRVRRLEPARERRPVERGPELAEVVVALRDLPEEEVRLGADAGRRVAAERVEAVGELLDHLGEGVLARLALLVGEPPPGRVDPVEGVCDVLAAHGANPSGRATVALS